MVNLIPVDVYVAEDVCEEVEDEKRIIPTSHKLYYVLSCDVGSALTILATIISFFFSVLFILHI